MARRWFGSATNFRMSVKFAHVVSPVKVGPSSDLYVAQPITFESMRVARQLAANFSLDVQLCAVNFSEDDEIVPPFFECRRHLERSVLDIGTFSIPRRLPLIKDILDSATAATNTDYIIYSNVDIAVIPHFYLSLDTIISEGWDAFMITRRTLSKDYKTASQLWRMYADVGAGHPGNDCFVFRREDYAHYDLGDACIGARGFAKVLGTNVIVHAHRFKHFKNLHLTFHIGDDRIWDDEKWADYSAHNLHVLRRLLYQYGQLGKLPRNPMIDRWVRKFVPPRWRWRFW
jgi:hypothetical protein